MSALYTKNTMLEVLPIDIIKHIETFLYDQNSKHHYPKVMEAILNFDRNLLIKNRKCGDRPMQKEWVNMQLYGVRDPHKDWKTLGRALGKWGSWDVLQYDSLNRMLWSYITANITKDSVCWICKEHNEGLFLCKSERAIYCRECFDI